MPLCPGKLFSFIRFWSDISGKKNLTARDGYGYCTEIQFKWKFYFSPMLCFETVFIRIYLKNGHEWNPTLCLSYFLLRGKQEQPLPREPHLLYIIRHLFQGLEWRFTGLHHIKHHANPLGNRNILLGFWVLHLCPCLTPSWRVFVLQWLKPEAEHRERAVLHGSSPLSERDPWGTKPHGAEPTAESVCRRGVTRQERTRINQERVQSSEGADPEAAPRSGGEEEEGLLPRSQINNGV